ncbi:MAG: sugar phosphate isomerase/epimerase [Gemmatimonadota bacterium]
MSSWELALGLYSVYDDWLAAPERALERVAQLGFAGLEFYGDPVMPAARLAGRLREVGLRNAGWHAEWRRLQPAVRERTLDEHQAAGTECVIVPALGGPWEIAHTRAQDCAQVWQRHAGWLSDLAGEVEARGMRAGYHTHEHEFQTRYADGQTPWTILCQRTGAGVVLEVDTGNCLAAGADPAQAIAAASGRARWVHAKPFSPEAGWETAIGAPDEASDWPAVLRACGAAGARWLVVEHESRTRFPGFAGAEACLRGLRALD